MTEKESCFRVSALDNEGTKAIMKEYPMCSKVKTPFPFFCVVFFPADNLRRYEILTNRKWGRDKPAKFLGCHNLQQGYNRKESYLPCPAIFIATSKRSVKDRYK